MCETNEELRWQLKQERAHNAALLNELHRYRVELDIARTTITKRNQAARSHAREVSDLKGQLTIANARWKPRGGAATWH